MRQSQFKDHFSKQAQLYAEARPTYPDDLFAYLASLVPSKTKALDCATGNGQAACSLAKYFDQIVAIDASQNQIQNAKPHPKVEYQVAQAEDHGLPSNSFDLLTVATSAHWFHLQAFYTEAMRVLKQQGILAIWTYAQFSLNKVFDKHLHHLSREILGDYWQPEAQYVWNGYQDLYFPFEPMKPPAFQCVEYWNFDEVINYIMSWSATQAYIDANATNPLDRVRSGLEKAWGHHLTEQQQVTWQLYLKVTRK